MRDIFNWAGLYLEPVKAPASKALISTNLLFIESDQHLYEFFPAEANKAASSTVGGDVEN